MKLRVDPDKDRVVLTIETTDKEYKTLYLPSFNIHYWYPFNINFYYKYSNSREMLYLVREKDYKGENFYKVDILKRTKPLVERNGVMFHPHVYIRNKYIIEKARALGLPTLKDVYTMDDVENGFAELDILMQTLKERLEDRVVENTEDELSLPEVYTEDWDKLLFEQMTEEEERTLTEFGEMYSMLTVMRKLVEGE